MLEKYLKKGDLIDLGDTTELPPSPAGTGEINAGWEARTLALPGHFHLFGEKDPASCHFMWLPWSDHAVNYVQSAGQDVVSGRFSGCAMIAYLSGGARRVAHVALPNARAAWQTIAAGLADADLLAGFYPDHILGAKPSVSVAKGETFYGVFGIITDTNQLHAFTFAIRKDNSGHILKMVNNIPSLTTDKLRTLPK